MGRRTTNAVKKKCTKCQLEKSLSEYYNSYSPLHADNKLPICKECIRDMVNVNDKESMKNMLRMVDKPFFDHLYQVAITKSNPIGEYFKLINAKDFRHMTWADTVEYSNNSEQIEINKNDNGKSPLSKENFIVTDEIIDKWGYGYSDEEYYYFEKKYQLLKNNYQEKTAMHTEALLIYIRYRVKEELATARGDVKEAKEWGALAQKAAQDAKINPSQLSKADLSDGLDTFGQLVRSVEQAVDIIPILPKFKERPQDKVDFALWCYINYIRDLKGLPLAEYEEIYKFYEQRKKEYEDRFGSLGVNVEEVDDV